MTSISQAVSGALQTVRNGLIKQPSITDIMTQAGRIPEVQQFMQGFQQTPQQSAQTDKSFNAFSPNALGNAAANMTPGGDILSSLSHAAPLIAGLGLIKDVGQEGDVVAKEAPEAFNGFADLTSQVLEKLKGSKTITPQGVSELTKMPGVKSAEATAVQQALNTFKDQPKIQTQDIANAVKQNLLPLTRQDLTDFTGQATRPTR